MPNKYWHRIIFLLRSKSSAECGVIPKESNMTVFDIFGLIGSICSIASLLVSFFIASKVVKISNRNSGIANVQGDKNITAGRDMKNGNY